METFRAALDPTPCCVVPLFAWPAVFFLMVALSYNEERYGLDRCGMLAFYPTNAAFKEEGINPKRKALEQAHMADHVLAQVSSVYSDFRLVVAKAVRKQHLCRTNSKKRWSHRRRS